MSEVHPDAPRRMALIASRGTLDWAYPPFILANAAATMGWEVSVFFTFYGLSLLLKEIDPEISPLGNPAMPIKMPFGPEGFQKIDWNVPTMMQGLPAFNSATTALMKKTFEKKGVATISELRDICIEMKVSLIACQMTMDVFGFERDDFIEETNYGGAATFLEHAAGADVTLFI